jgi:hypothetical protein
MHFKDSVIGLAALGMPVLTSAKFVPDVPAATPVAHLIERQQATEDPWQCATENIPQYFENAPQAMGSVLSAFQSYGDDFAAPCLSTAADFLSCVISDPKDWCGYTTAAPPDVLSDYSANYLSAAVSFWTENSATLSVLSESCPVAWQRPSLIEHEWLRIAKAHAECYLKGQPETRTDSSVRAPQSTSESSTPTDTFSSSIPTATGENGSNVKKITERVVLISTGFAILANAAW